MLLKYYIFFIILSIEFYRTNFIMRSPHKSFCTKARFGKIYLSVQSLMGWSSRIRVS